MNEINKRLAFLKDILNDRKPSYLLATYFEETFLIKHSIGITDT